MYLIDTNIFLEILLHQTKSEECKKFLFENSNNLFITDFPLHSIGVIAVRNNLIEVFDKFLNDLLPKVKIISLSQDLYVKLPLIIKSHKLDFDDAYQFLCAEENKLQIVTMDKDFDKMKNLNQIIFI